MFEYVWYIALYILVSGIVIEIYRKLHPDKPYVYDCSYYHNQYKQHSFLCCQECGLDISN